MSATQTPRGRSGRHGLTAGDKPDPIGLAIAVLNRLARTGALDRFGLRKPTERVVFEATRTGFRTLGAVNRQFARAGRKRGTPARVPAAVGAGVFDLTPTEDERMLVDVVTEYAAEVVRPAAAEADDVAAAPEAVLKASLDIGLPILGVPEDLGGISAAYSFTTSTSICSSSVGVRSKSPAPAAAGTLVGVPRLRPARANCRLTAPSVRNPVRVASNTTRSVGLRSPNRSSAPVRASRLRTATARPIGSGLSPTVSPCRPDRPRGVWVADMGQL